MCLYKCQDYVYSVYFDIHNEYNFGIRIKHEQNTSPNKNCTERFFKDYIILTNLLGPTFVWGRHLFAPTLIIGIDATK